MWKTNERTDDGRLPMTKAHMAYGQVAMWAKKINPDRPTLDFFDMWQ
jgi:hypothetical protein